MRASERAARLLPPLWALLVALFAASLLSLAVGVRPLDLYRMLFAGTWGTGYGIGQLLFKATPLLLTGLAVAVALAAGLFNIGAEGQLTVGALLAAWLGASLGEAPAWLALPLCLGASMLGGALVAAVAGLLRAYLGAHEVITTIMLNFIVRALMLGVGVKLFEREQLHSAPIAAGARLPRLASYIEPLHGSAVSVALLVALAAAALVGWLLFHTRLGFELRVVGASESVAATAGIAVARVRLIAMLLSGALAGLAAAHFVLGYKHYYEDGLSGGVGYLGIAVAVLGGRHPFGIVLAALTLGTLSQGALVINAEVPKELIDVLFAVLMLAVAAAGPTVRRLVARQAAP